MEDIIQIQAYAKGDTRNKIVISTSCLAGIHYVDVGYELAHLLNNSKDATCDYTLMCSRVLKSKHVDEEIGAYLAIKNIGILFEPELHINLRTILDHYSVGQMLIICAEGVLDNETFHFMCDDLACSIDLHGLSFKLIKND